jgi:hypothetical protein
MGSAIEAICKDSVINLHSSYWAIRKTEIATLVKKELKLDNQYNLKGEIKNVFEDNLVCVALSSKPRNRKYILDTFIKYLFLRASNLPIKGTYISSDSTVYECLEITPSESIDLLIQLVKIFKQSNIHVIFVSDFIQLSQ